MAKWIEHALLTAIVLAVLSVAFELHQVAEALRPITALSQGTIGALTVRETREQRNLRLQQQTRESIEDAKAILATPDQPRRPAIKSATPTSQTREQQPPR